MNIFIISNASAYGGSERSVELLAEELSKTHSICIFVENKRHLDSLKKVGVETISARGGKSIVSVISDLRHIASVVRKADLVIANTNKASFYLAILFVLQQWKSSVRYLSYVRDFQWQHERFIASALNGKVIYLMPSPAVRSYYHNIDWSSSQVVPDPVRVNVEERSTENTFLILCPAAISKCKGLDYLIRAVALTGQSDIHLKIVGEAAFPDVAMQLHELIHELNLVENVNICSYSENIGALYESSSVVINSTISEYGGPESFGRTIIEAWNYSKPVIAFECGGPKFLISDGVDGFLVEEKNVNLLSSAIMKLYSDVSLRQTMGKNGRQKVERCYSVEYVASLITS